jgi:hypothetical protein
VVTECGQHKITLARSHNFLPNALSVGKKIDISLDPALLMECRLGDWLALAPFPPP